ncbi:fumarylacetoacetate hydrolase family protein [Ideonella sp. 4Y16]|uniref:Fumarylacetoacetate hydrolase family protein n=1 Tax=Ideonella alba TaxID=2824118 RepID=A0A940Y7R9_9BURK|nr:fumarylacetoacetate hydrolase family protein [Ideonella alba]MBQ0931447.1 fumarylacetoacetate hydrolase family protein [Ideonella alba]MBQ0944964.1 fumarylacetoacetate hydrolase family protein [Ideonella alba]
MDVIFPPAPPVIVPTIDGRGFPVHRIYCVGRNYVDHAIEMGATGREPPFFFMKPADAVVPVAAGQTGHIPYPSQTKNLHHEAELVVAIGTGGTDIPVEQAVRHIFGYACGLDMTRRDLQNEMKKQGRPWDIGKSYDQSAPIGPIHPISATGELLTGAISLSVNGQVRQQADVSQLIWSVAETISVLSQAWALQPGDLIYTGTPAGVGAVVSGDRMDMQIDGLGGLSVVVD